MPGECKVRGCWSAARPPRRVPLRVPIKQTSGQRQAEYFPGNTIEVIVKNNLFLMNLDQLVEPDGGTRAPEASSF